MAKLTPAIGQTAIDWLRRSQTQPRGGYIPFMPAILARPIAQKIRISAFIATTSAQDTAKAASTQWRAVADQIRPKVPKLATIMNEAEHDVLAYMSFPQEHRAKLHSSNPLERLIGEIKRRAEVAGPRAISRIDGVRALEQNDDWTVQRARYMTLETIAVMGEDAVISLPAVASCSSRPTPSITVTISARYTTPRDRIMRSNPR